MLNEKKIIVFRLRRRIIPSDCTPYKDSRIFTYIIKKDEIGDAQEILWEHIIHSEYDGTVHEFAKMDLNKMQADYISEEEFKELKPVDQDPLIGNMYIYFIGRQQAFVLIHQDYGHAFGLLKESGPKGSAVWPWPEQLPDKIENFSDYITYYHNNPFNPRGYKL